MRRRLILIVAALALAVACSTGAGNRPATPSLSPPSTATSTPRIAPSATTAPPAPTARATADAETDTELDAPGEGSVVASAPGGIAFPNSSLTPGDVLPAGTAQICVSGYSRSVRNVSTSTRNQVYAEYGIVSHTTGQYEVDHLIPLELGGSNSIKNLWPEPAEPVPGFHQKDVLENRLHSLVCAGAVDLATAQQAIASNWYAAYIQWVIGISPSQPGPPPPPPSPTPVVAAPTPVVSSGNDYACEASDCNCSDFPSHAESQRIFAKHSGSPSNNWSGLDGDHDGIACESLR